MTDRPATDGHRPDPVDPQRSEDSRTATTLAREDRLLRSRIRHERDEHILRGAFDKDCDDPWAETTLRELLDGPCSLFWLRRFMSDADIAALPSSQLRYFLEEGGYLSTMLTRAQICEYLRVSPPSGTEILAPSVSDKAAAGPADDVSVASNAALASSAIRGRKKADFWSEFAAVLAFEVHVGGLAKTQNQMIDRVLVHFADREDCPGFSTLKPAISGLYRLLNEDGKSNSI